MHHTHGLLSWGVLMFVGCAPAGHADVSSLHVGPLHLSVDTVVAMHVWMQAGRSVDVPTYDFTLHARSEETRRVSTSSRWQQPLEGPGSYDGCPGRHMHTASSATSWDA